MDYNKLAEEIHAANKFKGWHDRERPFEELILLIQSEVFEAFEALRKGAFASADLVQYDYKNLAKGFFDKLRFKEFIKDTFEDEIADTAIRILDMAHAKGLTIGKIQKMKFDKSLFPFQAFVSTSARMYNSCDSGQATTMLGWCLAISDAYGFDLNKHIALKLKYNETRPAKHGKKF